MASRVTKPQREKLAQVVGVTGASTRTALECLTATGWSLEAAVDYYYSSGAYPAARGGRGPKTDKAAIGELFARYRDEGEEDLILAEGVSTLCEDLEVSPEDPVMLVLSYHLQAATMCEFSREEFEGGLARLACDSLSKLRAALPGLRAQLDDASRFPEIYKYAYLFSREKGQKCVQQDVAIAMWQLLLPAHRWRYTQDWCDFLQAKHNRAISRDTWNQLLDFILSVSPDFSDYDDAGAWPYLIDEFVEHMREKQQQQ
ncbi:hypothetical protein ACKKBF_B35300 [Auxenochlorella protothecoides x Auxenochlorella symbiontica]